MIYLASPYSHPAKSVRIDRMRAVAALCARFMAMGTWVYSPILHGHLLTPYIPHHHATSPDFWLPHCFRMMALCDSMLVLRLPGAHESLGIAAEIRWAEEHGLAWSWVEPEIIDLPDEEIRTILSVLLPTQP